MSVIKSRVNLTSAKFPLVSKYQGQTVMVGNTDTSFTPGLAPTEDGLIAINDRGIPQIVYCENVMPSEEGLQSIDYINMATNFVTNPPSLANATINRIFPFYNSAGEYSYLAVIATGPNIWRAVVLVKTFVGDNQWQLVFGGPIAGYGGGLITTAFINGRSYFYFEGATGGAYEYNLAFNNFTVIPLVNFAANLVAPAKGIFASSGYLCGWSRTHITNSSTVSPFDFVPSLATGAGATQIQEADSDLMIVRAHPKGAVIFTRTNAVGMTYTNNKNFPWNFRRIAGGGGLELDILAVKDVDEDEYLYAYTTAGLQKFNTLACRQFLPEVTDFLSGEIFESFDTATEVFSYTILNVYAKLYMRKKLSLIANRYLCISYAPSNADLIQYALVIDIQTLKWGKLKADNHVEIFEWREFAQFDVRENPRQSIALVNNVGEITTVGFNSLLSLRGGVLLLGKYQYVRQRNLQLQKVSCGMARVDVLNDFSIKTLISIDGQNIARTVTGVDLVRLGDTYVKGFESAVGLSHTLLITGRFYLKSLLLEFNNHGRN